MPTVSTSSHDPVLETQLFWTKYQMPILGGLLAIILGLGGFAAYRLYTGQRDASAAALLAQAKAAPDYRKVIDEYPSSPAAPSAYLLLADGQRKEKKFAEANGSLKEFIEKNPKHEFVATAKMAIAGNTESLGKPDEALEMYRNLASGYPRDFNAPFALLAQVHLLKSKGDIEGARRVCETVMTQYRESYVSSEAAHYLQTLKPAAAPVAAVPPSAQPAATAAASAAPSPATPAASPAP